jgi:hypothetical protein
MSEQTRELTAEDALFHLPRLRICRACGHDLITQHDPEDETCDAFGGMDVGVCPCGRRKITVGDHTMTPVEQERYFEDRARTAEQLAGVLADLDRCEHGRHEGDNCFGCEGPSVGNLIAQERRIGTTLGARPIRVPERGKGHIADDWIAS